MAKKKATPSSFQPGQSGNPAGRPVGTGRKTWETLVKDCTAKYGDFLAFQHPDIETEIRDPMEIALVKLIEALQNGERWAIEECLARGLGRPRQAVELTGADGESLQIGMVSAIEKLRSFFDGAGEGAPEG